MLENKMTETYEKELFRYGITCTDNLLLLRKINQVTYDMLHDIADKGEVPDREILEKIFSEAVQRIGEKTPEAVHEYFTKRHNDIIDKRDGNYSKLPVELCELCKVRDGVVIEIKQIENIPIYKVKYSNGEEFVTGKYLKDVKVNDKIRTHNKSAVKKL